LISKIENIINENKSKFVITTIPINVKNREKNFFSVLKEMAIKTKQENLINDSEKRNEYILKYFEYSLNCNSVKLLNDMAVDTFYHFHLLHPLLFHHDCLSLIGTRIHHILGKTEEDEKNPENCLKLIEELYS
jgi:hypothetical protein